jgi:hydroxyacylglutathione hydrolase
MTDETEHKAQAGGTIIPVTLFQQNCMLLWDEATRQAVVIDPGGDVPLILDAIAKANVKVEQIWLTHGHIDHVGGADELRETLKVEIIRYVPARTCRGQRREVRHDGHPQLHA